MIPVLASLVLEALHNSQAPVIQEGDLTFGATELLEHAQTVHLNLCQHGLRPDEPVIVLVENHPADFASFLGIWIAEGVAVPVHVGVPDTVLRGLAERTGARFIIRGDSGEYPRDRFDAAGPPTVARRGAGRLHLGLDW